MKPVRAGACLTAVVLAASGLLVGAAPSGGAATTPNDLVVNLHERTTYAQYQGDLRTPRRCQQAVCGGDRERVPPGHPEGVQTASVRPHGS